MAAHEAIAQAPGGGGGTPAPGVTHDPALGRWSIALPGRPPFYTTQREIREARVIVPAATNARTIVVLWNERDSTGHDFPARAISLDGGATVPVAGVTRYDIPLRFASFTPEWTGVSRPGALPGARPGAIGAGEPTIPPGLRAPPTNDVYIVQFVTQPLQEYRDAIAGAGGTIHHWLAYHSYVVQMTPQARNTVAAMPFVRWVGPLHVAYRIDPALITPAMAAGMPSNDPATARRYNIMVNRRGLVDKMVVAGAVEMLGGRIDFGVDEYGFLLGATLTEAQLVLVLRLNEVASLEAWGPPGVDTDIARQISGANYVESVTAPGIRGQGVRGEVLDGNIFGAVNGMIVQPHQAFTTTPPVAHGSLTPGQGISAGHGTSTFGIAFGSYNEGQTGEFKGMAPSAQGIFATYSRLEEYFSGGTVSREQHTAELVDPNGPYKAVFQSNSWGAPQTVNYTALSKLVDDILLHHDLAVFQSQSNLASRASRPEAWAKNVISVGGTKHRNTLDRADDEWNPSDIIGGFSCPSHPNAGWPFCPDWDEINEQGDPCQPRYSPCPYCVRTCYTQCGSLGPINGASIGPAADGRIKPDLSHFYDAVRAPGADPCTLLAEDSYNENFGGTSAATPIVAGCAALLFDMWHRGVFPGFGQGPSVFKDHPHWPTVKALLINSAYQYEFDSGPSHDLNRFNQGWGMPDLASLYGARARMLIIDESLTLTPFQSHSFAVTSDGARPLKVTMVYRDPGGDGNSSVHRVNDLDLVVVSPSGDKYYGNGGLAEGLWSVPGTDRDDRNTVENVFVQSPEAGAWTVVVSAPDLNSDGWPGTPGLDARYALVVSGLPEPNPVLAPDWNHDGAVDVTDLMEFFRDYGAGCALAGNGAPAGPSDVAAFIGAVIERVIKE